MPKHYRNKVKSVRKKQQRFFSFSKSHKNFFTSHNIIAGLLFDNEKPPSGLISGTEAEFIRVSYSPQPQRFSLLDFLEAELELAEPADLEDFELSALAEFIELFSFFIILLLVKIILNVNVMT